MTANTVIAQNTVFASPPVDEEKVVMETRFGVMTFDRAGAIRMPRGLLGYSGFHDFALANMPDEKLEQFKLLQSLSEPSLSFVVVPFNPGSDAIDAEDVEAACRTLAIAPADAAMLLVVATRRIGTATQISVNLRAPVILDTKSRTAWQQVLGNSRYPVRHVIGMVQPAAS